MDVATDINRLKVILAEKKRIIIPSTEKRKIFNKLMKIGITQSLIMPSLDSLCKDIVYIHSL